jgi:hypothetical protein
LLFNRFRFIKLKEVRISNWISIRYNSFTFIAIESPSIHNKQAVNQPLSKSVDSKETSSISNSAKISSPTTASQNSLSALQIAQEENDNKKKLYINNDQLDGLLDSESDEIDFNQLHYVKFNNNNHKIDHILHAKIQETSAKIHDNTDSKYSFDYFSSLNFIYFF